MRYEGCAVSVPIARVLLHAIHAGSFLFLGLTGVLLVSPALRATITGGYSLTLAAGHRWAGLLVLLPQVALLLAAGARHCFEPSACGWRAHLQRLHLAATLVLTALLTASGALLWAGDHVPPGAFEAAHPIHATAALVAWAFLALHLSEITCSRLAGALRNSGRHEPRNDAAEEAAGR